MRSSKSPSRTGEDGGKELVLRGGGLGERVVRRWKVYLASMRSFSLLHIENDLDDDFWTLVPEACQSSRIERL